MENIQETIKDIQSDYAFGDCAIFAVALSKHYDLDFVEFYDGKEMFHVALLIPGQNLKDDLYFDVFGLNNFSDIIKRYSPNNKVTVEVRTENELHRMTLFNNNDVERASKDLDILIQNNILPTKEEIEKIKIENLHKQTKSRPKIS